jgi:hypothetical protein
MSDRQNTIDCAFDPNSPRITAHQIHDWIYESLKLLETGLYGLYGEETLFVFHYQTFSGSIIKHPYIEL